MTRYMRDEEGSVLIFSLVIMILLFGFMGILVDTGRTVITHSRVQGYVDNLALAAANELDGQADALTRARAAVENDYIVKSALGGADGGEDFQLGDLYFLTDAPRADGRMLETEDFQDLITPDAALATHVLVTGTAVDVEWGMLKFVNSLGQVASPEAFQVSTWAAARLETGFCVEPMISMCAPQNNDWSGFDPGSQVKMVKNRDEVWEAGEYGIVTNISDDIHGTCSSYTGVDQLHCLMAINSHATDCGPNSVDFTADIPDINSGVDTYSVHAALNTRFGIFDPILGAIAVSDQVSPDANTISGALYSCTAEDFDEVSDSMGLPVDDCFHTGECDIYSDPISQDALELYWEQNHPGSTFPHWLETRFEIYQYEVLMGLLDVEGPEDSTNNICNPNASPAFNRRQFEIAIVDCSTMGDGEAFTDIEPVAYANAFLTEPVERLDAITFDGMFQGEPLTSGDVITSELSPKKGDGRSIDPYADTHGVTFGIKLSHKNKNKGDKNMPMLFDTVNWTGGDEDLAATDRGNIVIISEDGDSNDPDDEAKGGWFLIHFDEPTYVHSMIVFDTEDGGVVRLYDYIEEDPTGEYETNKSNGQLKQLSGGDGEGHDPDELAHLTVPNLGDGKHTRLDVGYNSIRTIAYFMPDSGGIDDIVIQNSKAEPTERDTITMEILETLSPTSKEIATFPIMTN
ncbi:MAG: Tad domain-containing protein [Pseudomonadota bacterium]